MVEERFAIAPKDAGWWLRGGVVGGALAGLIFAAFEIVAAAVTMGATSWLTPLRMIGAIVLGATALDPGSSAVVPGTIGVLVHLVLSAIFGGVFGWVAWAWPAEPRARLVPTASAYGLLLWLVNFNMIAPIAGWTWLPAGGSPVVRVAAHVFFFGAPLGLYLSRVRGENFAVRQPTLHERPWRAA
jgi:hypothetical protein